MPVLEKLLRVTTANFKAEEIFLEQPGDFSKGGAEIRLMGGRERHGHPVLKPDQSTLIPLIMAGVILRNLANAIGRLLYLIIHYSAAGECSIYTF